jgi:hypothetical protein
MVKQQRQAKNLSTRPEYESLAARSLAEYRFPCSIEPVSLVPASTETKLVDDMGSIEGLQGTVGPGYVISGALKYSRESYWPEPPHVAFANLLADKPEAVEAFTKRYGVLSRDYIDRNDPDGQNFAIDSITFLFKWDTFRNAWMAECATNEEEYPKNGLGVISIVEIESYVEQSFETDVRVSEGLVHLWPRDTWSSICFLFLWDARAGKLGFCGNPGCPAPYFRKKRKTQKYCEQGPCVQHAQRQYSLDWWNRVGKKRREKRVKT